MRTGRVRAFARLRTERLVAVPFGTERAGERGRGEAAAAAAAAAAVLVPFRVRVG
jgi:hypothetical protein